MCAHVDTHKNVKVVKIKITDFEHSLFQTPILIALHVLIHFSYWKTGVDI